MENPSISAELFEPITQNLEAVFILPHETEADFKTILTQLAENVTQLDKSYYGANSEMNILSVNRAIIIGRICNYVKGTLLHGAWTMWAEQHFTEGLRSLEKFMAIARFETAVANYAHLGTEKVYQLTRLLSSERDMSFEDAFSDTGQDRDFQSFSSKAFEGAINTILNKRDLNQLDVEVSNDALKALTENFSLIRNNSNVVTRLMEAKSEDANLDKTIGNIIAIGGGKRSVKKKATAPRKVEDVNYVAENFIRSFQEAMSDSNTINGINAERITFIGKLIAEYCQILSQTNP